MRDRAIGLVHLDLLGDMSTHRAVIEDLANAEALQVAEIVTIDHDTYMPITYAIAAAVQAGADTVIAPDLAHFGTGYAAMTLACDLLVPTGLIRRRPQPPGQRLDRYADSSIRRHRGAG
ncbi:hypothetical protein [Nocardia sp. NPDC057227]|uniref:hypothetical protein n=1 Tax=Nocardia sp. NPDC057227 TaxID=3346056 RepID=UPI003630E29A